LEKLHFYHEKLATTGGQMKYRIVHHQTFRNEKLWNEHWSIQKKVLFFWTTLNHWVHMGYEDFVKIDYEFESFEKAKSFLDNILKHLVYRYTKEVEYEN